MNVVCRMVSFANASDWRVFHILVLTLVSETLARTMPAPERGWNFCPDKSCAAVTKDAGAYESLAQMDAHHIGILLDLGSQEWSCLQVL